MTAANMRAVMSAIAVVGVIAVTDTAAAAAPVPGGVIGIADRASIARAHPCAPKPGLPAYGITAVGIACPTAHDIILQWTEMTRRQQCPRHLCQFRGLTCRSGSEVFFSPHVSCTAGTARRVSWRIPQPAVAD